MIWRCGDSETTCWPGLGSLKSCLMTPVYLADVQFARLSRFTDPVLANVIGGWEIVLLVLVFGVPVGVIMIVRAARGGGELPERAAPASTVGLRCLAKLIDIVVVLGAGFMIAAADEMLGGI